MKKEEVVKIYIKHLKQYAPLLTMGEIREIGNIMEKVIIRLIKEDEDK